MSERPHISASQIQTFSQCRLKHRLSQVLPRGEYDETAVAPAAGSLFHKAMESYLLLPPSQRDIGLLEDSLLTAADDKRYEWEDEIFDRARRFVRSYWRQFKHHEAWQPTHTEYKFVVPVSEKLDLHGFVDGVYVDEANKQIYIYEIKTHTRKPDPLFVTWGSIQSQCYRYALQHNYPDYYIRNVDYLMIWPSGATSMTREFNPYDQAWDAKLRQYAHEMETLPVVDEPGFHCKYCPFFEEVCLRASMLGTDPLEIVRDYEDTIVNRDEDEV